MNHKSEGMRKYWRNTLTNLRGKIRKYDFVGFDVETYGDENEFLSGGFYFYEKGKEVFEYFYDKEEMLKFILSRRFKNKYVVATNLGFDLSVLFWGTKYWNNIHLVSRGSDILMANYDLGNNNGKIRFIDTFNFVGFGVAHLGRIIGVDKLNKPIWLGDRKPRGKVLLRKEEQFLRDTPSKRLGIDPYGEWEHLKRYNKVDCKISCDFMYFLQEGINKAGGNLKVTIGSTSMDVWRRGHLDRRLTKESYALGCDEVRDFIFSAYYGGRTEVFQRGTFNNVNYYDINSLYPSVMKKSFPVPQSVKKVNVPSVENIRKYEGVTECDVNSPIIDIPLLPIKLRDGKLIFPVGDFKGTWNNVELRKALELGYKITPRKQIIYTETFKPFGSYVDTFYDMRMKEKEKGSPLELVYKLLLVNLYGKFAQKNRQSLKIKIIKNLSDDELMKYAFDEELAKNFVVKDDVLIEIKKGVFDGIFSFPIFSSYTTSYARLLMYDYLQERDVIYMDTDSIVTKDELKNTSRELGCMKLEGHINTGIFIKPKMYMLDDDIKIKGVTRCTSEEFKNILGGGTVTKMKFSKLRESVRRGIKPNTKINVTKSLNLKDTKRKWNDIFIVSDKERSTPLEVTYVDGVGNILLSELEDFNNKNLGVENKNFNTFISKKNYNENVREYLRQNPSVKKKFKGKLKELAEVMILLMKDGYDLDVFDWYSLGVDKPLSEYYSELVRGVV